jgi:hypothetical protein
MPAALLKSDQIPTFCDFWAWQPGFFHEGDTIRAYDKHETLCGDTLAADDGTFLLHVYGDDSETMDMIEGPNIGDTLHFTLNGMPLNVEGVAIDPDTAIVSGSAAVFQDLSSYHVRFSAVINGVDERKQPESLIYASYPNPFNSRTMIQYTLDVSGEVQLKIYDASGRLVRSLLMNTNQNPGLYNIPWDGLDDNKIRVPSGIYLAYLQTVRSSKTIKLVLVN